MKNLKIIKTLFFGGLSFAVFFIFGTTETQAETICSFAGPDLSPDFLRLTDFEVSNASGLRVGETITVQFKLQNYGQSDINLAQRGIFIAARDPDNLDVSFGFSRANTILKIGETVLLSSSKTLDKAGTWTIWPSYHILAGKEYKLGPDYWHSCTLQVAPAISDSDKDGIPDEEDNCPKKSNPQQEDIDGDGRGDICDSCDDRDSDKDKIKNCLDDCPDEPENYNQYQDDDGCPDEKPEEIKDSDGDGILDDKDKCPKEKETFNNYQDDDGCPDEVPVQEPPQSKEPEGPTPPSQKPLPTPQEKETEIVFTPDSCIETFMLKAKLSYEEAKQKCSATKEELIKNFAEKIKEINIPEIGIISKIKINSKTAFLDGIEIPSLPIIVDVENKNVRLQPFAKGLIIEEDGVKAEGDVEIEYQNGKLISTKSQKEIKILPSQVGEKTQGEIKEIKIEDQGIPKYLVKSKRKGKFLVFIPVPISVKYEIGATDGASKEKKPWWSFAVKILPDCQPPQKLISGSCCLDENYNNTCDDKEGLSVNPATNVQVFLPEAECGDKQCYITERTSCCQDCGCPVDFRCQEDGSCLRITSRPAIQPSIFPDSYIVVTLDEMIVHDDTDPAAAGELQLITLAASGENSQTMYWPVELWRPVNTGNRVLGGTPLEKIPVFSLKENQMGERLAISFRAVDNDEMPAWLEGLITVLSAPFGLLSTMVELLAELLPLPPLEAMVYWETELSNAFNELISDNELIGAVTQIYERDQNWGVREEPYTIRRGGLTVKYSIHRVFVPKGSEIGVKINKVVVRDTGDYFDGEVWFRMRCANNFGEGKIQEVKYRIPRSGTYSWGGNNSLEGPLGPTVEVSPGVFEAVRLPIIECQGNGPFNFVEISVWDEDEPNVGDDHDLLGHFTETVLYPEAEARISTYPRGNIDIWLEYIKR